MCVLSSLLVSHANAFCPATKQQNKKDDSATESDSGDEILVSSKVTRLHTVMS